MDLTREKVLPFLDAATAARTDWLKACLPVLQLRLNERYGAAITDVVEPVFVETAGEALNRRSERQRLGRNVRRQSIGGAYAELDPRLPLGSWFTADEIADLDALVGRGGTRTIRMSAPDAVRYGNRSRPELDDWEP